MRLGLYEGRVVNRDDPLNMGRVKIILPGIWDEESSPWVRPLGILDNVEGRGIWCVPQLKANVAVMFVQGDTSNEKFARYIADCWPKPPVTGIPNEAEGGKPDIMVIGFKNFAIVADERQGQEKITFIERRSSPPLSSLQFDIANKNVILNCIQDFERTVARDEKATIQGDWKVTVTGNAEIKTTGSVSVEATGGITAKAGVQTVVSAPPSGNPLIDGTTEVKIGAAAQDFVALKTQLLAWMQTHTHDVPLVTPGTGAAVAVPSTTPVAPSTFTTKTKAE